MMSPSTSRSRDRARAEGLRQVALADESVELPTRWRLPLWALVLKLVLVTGGLLLLLHWALQRLPDDRPALDLWSLLGAILLNQLALHAAAWRLQATLAAFGVSIRRGQAMRIHLQSLFYFFFVPMSVGLEIARFLKVRDIDPTVSAKRLLFALLFDRVLGLAGVLLVVGMLLPLVLPALLPQLWHPGWLLFAVVVASIIGAASWLHPRLRELLLTMIAATAEVRQSPPLLIALSLAALLLVCASVYVIAISARIDIGLVPLTFALSASLLGMMLPVSLLGATVREAAGIGIFAALGISAASGMLLVTTAYGGRLLGALQGAIIELWMDGNPLIIA
ncbi:MAG: lysylphosphatidylglycerol synthase transmembrane domain-containing protein, partial [Thiohalocapsa sp.]